MEKIIKLVCADDNDAICFNPKHVNYIANLGKKTQVGVEALTINVKASWDKIRKLFHAREFTEFVQVGGTINVLVNADRIIEWHEQDDGVLLELGDDRVVVQGTLEEVTAKIEKALEGCAS